VTSHTADSQTPVRDSFASQHTLLVATVDEDRQAFLAAQLDADGHTVYEAHRTEAVIERLSPIRSTY
jgi:hypothetical protein